MLPSYHCMSMMSATPLQNSQAAELFVNLAIPQNNLCNIDQNAFPVFTYSVGHSK